MSDKHESKQKQMRAKAHLHDPKIEHRHEEKNARIDPDIKDAAGTVQEDLGKIRRSAGNAHRG